MAVIVDTKLIKIGSSMGIILPKRILSEQHLKNGSRVEVMILSPNRKEILKMGLGFAKRKVPFRREKDDFRAYD